MLFIRRVFHLSRSGPSPVVARNKKRDASADGVPLRIVRVGSNCDTLHRVIPAATVPLSPDQSAFAHMDKVTGSEMDFGNLAILICPSILYPRHGSMNSSPYQRSSYQSNTPWNSMARISRKKCDTYQKAEAVNGRLPTLGPYNGPNGSTPRIGPGSGPINSPIVPRERPPPPPASQRPYGVSQPIPSYPSASSQHGHIGNMNTPRTPQTEEWTSQRAPVTPSGPLTPSRPSSYTGHSWSYVSRGGKVKVETTRYFPATSHRDPKTTPRSSIIFSITYATYVHWQS
ncbi:hypothetical protein F5880DRAFT_1628381 [Lentinula raphanica]|nr:hypothetical protein F5880DRAFT_1628381 [Lentinula raphanica]